MEKRIQQIKLSELRRAGFDQPIKPEETLSLTNSGEELGEETRFLLKQQTAKISSAVD